MSRGTGVLRLFLRTPRRASILENDCRGAKADREFCCGGQKGSRQGKSGQRASGAVPYEDAAEQKREGNAYGKRD